MTHKRMIDNSELGNRSWQLCDEHVEFKDEKNSWANHKFREWDEVAKYNWKFVTCEKCLALKPKKSNVSKLNANCKHRAKELGIPVEDMLSGNDLEPGTEYGNIFTYRDQLYRIGKGGKLYTGSSYSDGNWSLSSAAVSSRVKNFVPTKWTHKLNERS